MLWEAILWYLHASLWKECFIALVTFEAYSIGIMHWKLFYSGLPYDFTIFTQAKTYEISALAWGQEIIFYICFWSLFCLPWLQIRNSVSFRTSHLDWRIQAESWARTCQGSPAVEAPENIFWKCLKCDKKKCDRTWREPTEQSHWEYIDFDVKLRDLVLHIVAFELVVVDVQVGDHSIQPFQPGLNQYLSTEM